MIVFLPVPVGFIALSDAVPGESILFYKDGHMWAVKRTPG